MLSVERRGHVARSAGVERGWDMPVALWHAPRGFDTISGHVRGTLSHHVLSFSVSGPMTEAAVEGRRLVKTDPGSLSVEAVGSENGFRALGESRFAHLYFRDGFVRRLGAELYGEPGDRDGLLRDDLVFFRDPELRRMAGDYLARAIDAADPPTVLEMDSRAVLVGLRLFGQHSVLAPPGVAAPRRGGLAPWRLRRATEWLEAHLADDARLSDLAAAVGLSERHLCTAFRRPPAGRRTGGCWSAAWSARRSCSRPSPRGPSRRWRSPAASPPRPTSPPCSARPRARHQALGGLLLRSCTAAPGGCKPRRGETATGDRARDVR